MQKQFYCLAFPVLMIIFILFAITLSFATKKNVLKFSQIMEIKM